MGPSINIQVRFNLMSLRSMENITKQSWDMIPMPDTVIDWINIFGRYQQEILVFTDCKNRIIGDYDVNLTGVDGDGDEKKSPLKIEN